MILQRKIVYLVVTAVVIGLGWLGYSLFTTWRGIPDAYAAWDTGTLLVEYLETHDNQWPRSWEELLAATETLKQNGKHLRGANGEGGFIYGDLRSRVAIDWNADPQVIAAFDGTTDKLRVVTRADGTDFPVVWSGAEPNGMIWRYLNGLRVD
jgi:hypothetical protein